MSSITNAHGTYDHVAIATRVKSAGVVKVKFNVVTRGMAKLGFVCSSTNIDTLQCRANKAAPSRGIGGGAGMGAGGASGPGSPMAIRGRGERGDRSGSPQRGRRWDDDEASAVETKQREQRGAGGERREGRAGRGGASDMMARLREKKRLRESGGASGGSEGRRDGGADGQDPQ